MRNKNSHTDVKQGWIMIGRLYGLIEPFYPKPGRGRRRVGLERKLRIYFLRDEFGLSDRAAEEALYDSEVIRRFVGIVLEREPVPDETTILNFRHLLERHELHGPILREVNEYHKHSAWAADGQR